MNVKGSYLSLLDEIRFSMARQLRSYYIGCLGDGNLGDDALFRAVQEIFSDQYNFYTAKNPGFLLRKFGSHIRIATVILGGGTLIKKGYHVYLGRLNKAIDLFPEAELIVFGTGVADALLWESFGVFTDIDGWRTVLNKCNFLGVRGPLSKQHLIDWGVKNDIKIIGDPAIWFARDSVIAKSMRKRIGINLGTSHGKIHGQDEENVLDFGVHLTRLLQKSGWKITFFPMNVDDLVFLNNIVRKSGLSSGVIHQSFHDLEETLKLLEKQDVFIGEKLHSVILADCVYTPSIMIEYRTKCRDYMMSVGRQDWLYKTDDLDAEVIFARILQLYDDVDKQQEQVFSSLQCYKTLLQDAASEVMNMHAS